MKSDLLKDLEILADLVLEQIQQRQGYCDLELERELISVSKQLRDQEREDRT